VLVLVRLLGAPPTGGTHLESNAIWREIREAVFNTLNQVGGCPGDYMAQQAIDDGSALKVIDGFGGLVGYDLNNIDAVNGPI
jgi:hypothetical protein